MTTKIWRGDATAVAQITTVIPVAAVTIGDIFALAINSKRISVTATAATAANVATLFAAAIAAADDPEWQEVTATVSSDTLVLTAATAGVPFVVTADSSLDALEPITVVEVTAGLPSISAVQVVTVPVTLQGTWRIFWDDEVTTDLASGATAAAVQTALEVFAAIAVGDVVVARSTSADGNDYLYQLTFQGALANKPIAPVLATASLTAPYVRRTQVGVATGAFQNDIQTITLPDNAISTGVHFTVTIDGQTSAVVQIGATATTLQNALNALSTVEGAVVTRSGDVFTVDFSGFEANSTQALLTVSVWKDATGANLTTAYVATLARATATAGILAVNEVQRVTLNGGSTGGTWTLAFGANTATGLAYNISAAALDAALEALASVGVGNVSVTGSAGAGFVVTFIGTLAAANQALLVANGSGLTGASSTTLTVTDTTASAGPNHWDTAANWAPVGVPITGDDVRFEDAGEDCLYGLAQSAVTLASLTISMAWQNRKLGLPHLNPSGYLEYREQQLTIGATVITVGVYQGTGPSRVYLDTGTAPTAIEIRNTGSSADSYPAVVWIGANAANSIVMMGGDFGTAPYADTVATLDRLTMYGGRCVLRNAAIVTSLKANRNPLLAFESTLGGKAIEV